METIVARLIVQRRQVSHGRACSDALAIIPPLSDEKDLYGFGDKKWIFWTENPLGSMLFDLLETMVTLNILEKHEGDDHLYRWNARFEWGQYQRNSPPRLRLYCNHL